MLHLRRLVSLLLPLFTLTAAVTLAACGDDGGTTPDPVALLEADVCEHFTEGPILAVTAGADAASAADITGTHTRFDITLVDVGGGANGGYVSLAVSEATEYGIYLGANVGITVTDAAGATITPAETKVGSDVCALIGVGYHLDFAVGTYTIAFAPGAATLAQLVYLDPGDDHADE